MTDTPTVALLGPQRRVQTVAATLQALTGAEAHRPVAVVSAGWEERELELDEFEQHIGGRAINLEVYHRVEEIYTRDPRLRDAMRERHDRMRALQELYRVRLSHALDAARTLLATDADPELVEPERAAAIEAVRAIDAHHLSRLRVIHEEFRARVKPADHPLVMRYREHLRQQLEGCAALCIAGGHVAILLNRLRLAGVLRFWDRRRPIVAWGAGAMALTERVIVFHDNPPQGPGNAEVLEVGLGHATGVVALPDARRRLRLDDPRRVALFARRFGPSRCVALDSGCRVVNHGATWRSLDPTRELGPSGKLEELPA